jgi:hypothetical protein
MNNEEYQDDRVTGYESNQADAGRAVKNPTLLMFLTPTTTLSSSPS